MNNIKNFKEFNSINEGLLDGLKKVWDKIKDFFSTKSQTVLRNVKSAESKEDKKEILESHIDSLVKSYIKEVENERAIEIMELSSDLRMFFKLYEKIVGEKHPRDISFTKGFLGGYYAWDEVIKSKGPEKLDNMFKNQIKNLKDSQKKELKNLEEDYETFKDIISNL